MARTEEKSGCWVRRAGAGNSEVAGEGLRRGQRKFRHKEEQEQEQKSRSRKLRSG